VAEFCHVSGESGDEDNLFRVVLEVRKQLALCDDGHTRAKFRSRW
jgi:hypothetical protein